MYALQNENLRLEVSARGAEIQSLVDLNSGREIIWQGDAAYWNGRSPILFPITGGLWDGTCRLDGRSYQIPKHGFVRRRDWQLVEQGVDFLHLAVENTDEELGQFPWPYRLAEVSANIIDQCVAQGVPFAREYGGLLDNRSFGGVQVSRTFYARGQTGQQLLIGAYQALERQVAAGTVKEYSRHEMVELIVDEGKARGIIARDMSTGKLETFIADAVVLATGGYGNVFFLSTNAMGCNATAIWRAYRKGAYFGNPCFTQIHPTCIPQHGETAHAIDD